MQVRYDGSLSDEVDVTRGVLQGEELWALIFPLQISDVEELFLRNGATGISIVSHVEVMLSIFADDKTLFADSYSDHMLQVNLLSLYSDENKQEVSTEKTKIKDRETTKVLYYKGSYRNSTLVHLPWSTLPNLGVVL